MSTLCNGCGASITVTPGQDARTAPKICRPCLDARSEPSDTRDQWNRMVREFLADIGGKP